MARTLSGLIVVALVVSVLCLAYSTASAQEGEKKVSLEQVPKAVKEAILKAVGKGRLVDIGVFKAGEKTVYEIEMVVDGREYDVLFDSDGKVLNRRDEGAVKEGEEEGDEDDEADSGKRKAKKEKIELDKAPKAVQKTLLKEAGKNEITDVVKITLKDGKTVVYEGEWGEKGKTTEVLASSDGKIINVTKQITFDDVPKAAKETILKELGANKLEDIEVVTEGKTTVYEAEWMENGKEIDLQVSPEGKIISRETAGKEEGEEDGNAEKGKDKKKADKYQSTFDLENRKFSTRGKNKYFILEPGYQLVLEGKEGERTVRLQVTVLDETKKVGGIDTRVVEERESVDGELIEISRNFFAICRETKSVFYFGEEVDIYKDGKVIAHEGAWLHGENGARAGMMMPGEPILGAKYYQEVAPKVALDRAKIVDLSVTLKTPAGTFTGCLKCQEENPLDKEKEFKIHAPGIGLVQDEDLLLIKYGFVKK